MMRIGRLGMYVNAVAVSAMLLTSGCAMVGVPESRNVNIPAPTLADSRKQAINDRPDSVMYLPLGEDVLVPEAEENDDFPHEMVGPFELRGETLAGALQLILADYDISLAFETQEGLTRRVTVANLRGDLGKVVHQVCSLANLYCSYEDGSIVIKDTQTFTVTLPPIGTDDETAFLDDVAEGLSAILGAGTGSDGSSSGNSPIVDPTTRTIVYSATQRTADMAARYFQRLRANTAMIVFETYIWEVSLNSGNSAGVDWTQLSKFGKFNTGISLDGDVNADFLRPVSIGLPTTSAEFDGASGDLFRFLSQFGAVKAISQPQITVLSGAEAELRVADTQNYVSQIATTLDEGQSTTSVNTDSVDTGFTLTIGSTWDKATVYANIDIELTDVKQIDNFAFSDTGDDGGSTTIQLPQTSERQLSTQIRVRPGDSVLIAGLKRENDNFDSRGIGLMQPLLPDSRTAQTENLELVILLRPRVIVYTASNDKRYVDYAMKKHKVPGTGQEYVSPDLSIDTTGGQNVYAPEPLSPPSPSAAPQTVAPMVGMPAPAPVVAQPLALPEPSATPYTAVTPSWEQADPAAPTPILKDNMAAEPSDWESRFRRGEGFVSHDAPVSNGQAVTTYPLADPAPAPAIPLYNPGMPTPAPVQSAPPNSPYDAYNYYTPTY